MSPARLYRADARADSTYTRVLEALVEALTRNAIATKKEIFKEAQAETWKEMIRWPFVINWAQMENPGVIILPLSARYFQPPRSKSHTSVLGKYVSPNYTQAAGFASLAQFVQISERNRGIALAKYSQQQIVAAKALESAERFSATIGNAPALYLPGAA